MTVGRIAVVLFLIGLPACTADEDAASGEQPSVVQPSGERKVYGITFADEVPNPTAENDVRACLDLRGVQDKNPGGVISAAAVIGSGPDAAFRECIGTVRGVALTIGKKSLLDLAHPVE